MRDISSVKVLRNTKNLLFVLIGITLETIGLQCFLTPNGFIEGGATGVALLLNMLTEKINVSVFLLVVNLPFIFLAVKQMGLRFAVTVAFSIVLLAISLYYFPAMPITHDRLIASVFGGVCVGAGTGFAIRGSSAIDGSEVLAIFVSRFGFMSLGGFIAFFNVILFAIAAFITTPEQAMYSTITYMVASRSIDFIVSGIEEYIGITIISQKHKEIRHKITDNLGRGVTVYRAGGGYAGAKDVDRKILYTVVTRLEISRILHEIEVIDPKAFVVQTPVKDIRGGIIKRRPTQNYNQ